MVRTQFVLQLYHLMALQITSTNWISSKITSSTSLSPRNLTHKTHVSRTRTNLRRVPLGFGPVGFPATWQVSTPTLQVLNWALASWCYNGVLPLVRPDTWAVEWWKMEGFLVRGFIYPLQSLKLTASLPEHGWLEDDFAFGMAYFQG